MGLQLQEQRNPGSWSCLCRELDLPSTHFPLCLLGLSWFLEPAERCLTRIPSLTLCCPRSLFHPAIAEVPQSLRGLFCVPFRFLTGALVPCATLCWFHSWGPNRRSLAHFPCSAGIPLPFAISQEWIRSKCSSELNEFCRNSLCH